MKESKLNISTSDNQAVVVDTQHSQWKQYNFLHATL